MSADADRYLERAFRSQPNEIDRGLGAVPADLEGLYLTNGPGLTTAGTDPLGYFDAYGMVCATTFASGKATFKNRHVRTTIFEQEQAAGRQLARRTFTNLPSRWKNVLNLSIPSTAMHDSFAWGDRIYATDDRGHWALDRTTLQTLGPETWGGRLARGELSGPLPRYDAATDRLIAFKISPGLVTRDVLTIYEFAAGWEVRNQVQVRLSKSNAFVHDIAFTDDYFLFFETPLRLAVRRALGGRASIFSAFDWPAGARSLLWVVRRDGTTKPFSLEAPSPLEIVFHIANAFDEHGGSGRLVLDVAGAIAPLDFSSTIPKAIRERQGVALTPSPHAHFHRLTVDPTARSVSSSWLGGAILEEPTINGAFTGRAHRYSYGLGASATNRAVDPGMVLYADKLVRVDAETQTIEEWASGTGHPLSQPAFAPRRGATAEDDGYLITTVLDVAHQQSEILLFEAARLAAGPIARLPLGDYFCPPSHSRFAPARAG